MKRNLSFEMEFPLSTFLLSISKNNSTDSRIEGKGYTNYKNTETGKTKTGYFGCEVEFAEV